MSRHNAYYLFHQNPTLDHQPAQQSAARPHLSLCQDTRHLVRNRLVEAEHLLRAPSPAHLGQGIGVGIYHQSGRSQPPR